MNTDRKENVIEISQGDYVSFAKNEVSAKAINNLEWTLVTRLQPIPLTLSAGKVKLTMHDRLQQMYKLLGRKNIPNSDKIRVLIYLQKK